jgi:hypothetical protein
VLRRLRLSQARFLMRFLSVSLLLAVLIAAVGCGPKSATGVSIDSAFRPFLPSNAIALAQIDFQTLRQTPFYRRHEEVLQTQAFDGMAERVGIDPRRDVAKLLLVWNGKEPFVLAKGQFPTASIDAKLTSLGAQRMSYKNFILFGSPARSSRDAVAFVNDQLAIAGPVPAVHEALDNRSGGSGGIPDVLRRELSRIHKGDQLWEVSSGPLLANVPLPSNWQSALSNIASYVSKTHAGMAVDSGVHVDAEITCISDEGAKRVHDALRGSIGLARLATNNNNLDLLRLWDSFKVSQSGPTVEVNADLSPDLADKLVANAPRITNRAREELRQR